MSFSVTFFLSKGENIKLNQSKRYRRRQCLSHLFVLLLEGCIALNVPNDDFRKKKKKKKVKEQGKGEIAQGSANSNETKDAGADEKHLEEVKTTPSLVHVSHGKDEHEGNLSNEK